MKLSYSAIWDDTTALLRAHASLVAALAGVFLFLPALVVAYLLPQPVVTDPSRALDALVGFYQANWPWLLLAQLVRMVGAAAILQLVFGPRGTSVAGAIVTGLLLLPSYFAAHFLAEIGMGIGFLLLIVPGVYLMGRFAPLGAVIVAERRRNPIDALTRSFALSAGHGWSLAGLVLLVAIAAGITMGVAHAVSGILFVLVAGKAFGTLLVQIVDAAAGAAFTTLFLLLYAAIYRALSPSASAAVFE
ncbi:MAG TPA: hypothetical protein VGC56_15400 [Allosphingosinicella sp.]|jgi:hypothetical protein